MKALSGEDMKYSDGQFKGFGDTNLYCQCWLPLGKFRAILLVVHGLAEHSGRYSNLVNYFVPRGYGVYGYDQRGHGKSEGMRGYVDKFSSFVSDLNTFLKIVQSRHRGVRVFIVGHSIGGTIAAFYTSLQHSEFGGLILSGASLITPADAPAILIFTARLLSRFLPRVGLYTVDAKAICQNENVVRAYVCDPLVYRGKIRARLGVELIKAMEMVKQQAPQICLPILIMHGAADRLSDPKGSQMLYENTGSADKTLKLYEGFYHEIFNEPEREQVFTDMEAWLITRV